MFTKKFVCLEEHFVIEDVNADYKIARRVGQYKVSGRAIYKPDNTYIPVAAITNLTHDKTVVHVSGCCAGGVPVERLVIITDNDKYQFIFDSAKDINKVIEIIGLTLS